MHRTSFIMILALSLLPAACRRDAEPDAYGNVEGTEVVVGAESGGRIETLAAREGARLQAGQDVGTIETTQLGLERDQLLAQQAAIASRANEVRQQINLLEVQRKIARRAYERTLRLFRERAATAQQLDQAERDFRTLGGQIETARAQVQSVNREVEASTARVAQLSERMGKGRIINPIAGTVLAVYARAGEITQPGQPLYRIANLESLEVRAYVSESQLSSVKIGQQVRVSVDDGGGKRRVISGTVTWVSADAEFTPTPIQTRAERADLVYAVKINVANPAGVLKIGMPVDVDFIGPAAVSS